MDSNDDFAAKWKPISEKGMAAYIMPDILFLTIGLILVTTFFIIHDSASISNLGPMIMCNLSALLSLIAGKVLDWYRKEKRYKEIMHLFETIDRCPACSAKTTAEDEKCPSCGTTLKVKNGSN